MGRDLSPDEIIATGRSAGALDYLAPEQIQGRALDGRADLYSLACAGFELLCGTPPFGQDQGLTVMYAQLYAPPPAATARRPELPAAVDLVLATALAKNPADRYPTGGNFADELRTALGLRPGAQADPVPSRSPGRAGSAAESRPASSQEGLAGQHESGPEPAPARVPAQSEPGRPPWRRPGVIGLILALAAAGIAAAVTLGVVLPTRPAAGRPAAGRLDVSSPVSSPLPSPAATSARSPTPAPSSAFTLASGQAAAVNDLLGSSAATRKTLQGAVGQARACTDLASAITQIQNAVNQRSAEYNQASALSTSALPGGKIVKTDLTAALGQSLAADRDYLSWARQLKLGCVPAAQSGAFNVASAADEQADAAKQAFVQVWNPVAARYGIQQESPDSI
jgi:hypothetical protein